MRDDVNMALVVSDSDRPPTKVWQPWYMGDGEVVGKSTPTKLLRENRMRMRTHLQKSPRKPSSPRHAHQRDDIDATAMTRYLHHRDRLYIVSPEETQYEDDGPLDMSLKRRSPPMAHATPTVATHAYTPPPPPLAHSYTPPPTHFHGSSPPPAHTSSPPPYLRLPYLPNFAHVERPSVITCAVPRYAPHPEDFASEKSSLPPPPPYSVATAHRQKPLRQAIDLERMHRLPSGSRPVSPPRNTASSESRSRSTSPTEESASRRQLVQGAGDMEIEEHFRRSLGKKTYQKLFTHSTQAEETPDSGDSVEEHFRKALGDTWLKIKDAKTESPARPSDSYSPSSLPPPCRERVSISARSATPPEPIFKGTPDVSITRVPALSDVSRLAHLS